MSSLSALASQKDLNRHVDLSELVRRVSADCRRAGVPVEVLGVAPLRLEALGRSGTTDWIVVPANNDPLVKTGQMAIPAKEQNRLARIAGAGIEPAELFIAHELPGGALGNDNGGFEALTKTQLATIQKAAKVPAPHKTARLSERLGDLSANTAAFLSDTVAAAVAAPLVLAAMVDPVIIGAFTTSGEPTAGEPAAFVILAQWDW